MGILSSIALLIRLLMPLLKSFEARAEDVLGRS